MNNKLFKGFIKSKGKQPLSKVIGGTYEQLPPIDSDYVGVLKDDYVQVDIDDKKYAETILKIVRDKKIRCDVLETKRGLHFYFKDTNRKLTGKLVHYYSAIGIPADYACGWKNATIPLRITYDEPLYQTVNGELIAIPNKTVVVRNWLQKYDELDEIPCWLLPVSKKDLGLLNITQRNNTLFSYKLTLNRCKFDNDEIEKVLRIINDYILEEPLPDRELMVISRNENFDDAYFFDEKGRFLHDMFGNAIISARNVVSIDGISHIYNREELYSPLNDDFEKIMIDKLPTIKANQRMEVLKYMKLQNLRKEKLSSPKYIGLKDEVLDIETMETHPYNPSFILRNRINYNYNSNAYHELLDKTIDKVMCYDKDLRLLFEEMLGYCLYTELKFQKCFMLTGSGSNGKSTILNLIKELIGFENYSTLSVQELEERFKPVQLVGKLANLGDDIPDKYLNDTSVFKSVITGGAITVERKGEQPFNFSNRAKFIFATNNPPKSSDKTDGFLRRIIFIPFNAKFNKDDVDYDPFIEDKLLTQDSMEYLLKIAIDGLKRLLENNKFTECDKSKNELKNFEMINNNVIEWLEENPKLHLEKRTTTYNNYCFWANENGVTPFSYKGFLNTLLEKRKDVTVGEKRINGKTTKVFLVEGIDNE